jgi:biopolymer transport protein ExbB
MFLKILLLQSTVAADSLSTAKGGSQSILDIILNSGTFGVLIVLIQIVLMFMAVYIFVERYLAIKKAGRIDQNFMNNIRMSVQSGNIAAARALCNSTDTPVARMVEKGLQRIGKPLRDIDAAIENVGNIEIFKLEKNLANLASISGAAPMLGFLGTVTGMILAFQQMATAETITPSLLASGIYQALLTTAFGLAVGIFALIGYNLLVANVDKVVYQMEQSTVDFMDFLQEPTA